ncbi:bifunctional methylenetetrahydrofolate dehydrogenase/methenyltetrahydrofolate cyclohydrolase FolD [Tsuneonella rigui]|uniref:bifunctional methylenetetrahydrofolate dehydrogenase/methenyltetrahydrofolate cyclohydrolase FolD n=1 Tax=Tsuneonella rigui TaxID=1708790 RepID=UPI000F7F3EB0|nr:bifunctional methylenetetrahydrofolate dehydrogenase/methenyltetrahydrofolate cyclohydrolase FolD [Tsuneonella rigui]
MSAPARVATPPTAAIIDGRALARNMRCDIRARVVDFVSRHGVVPGLAVILVGDDPASAIYVGNKIKACEQVGIHSRTIRCDQGVTTADLLALVETLNRDPAIHGILIQLPLPAHIDMPAVLDAIDVNKDVDGFHLYNIGGLIVGSTVFSPCTPYGVLKLLEHANIPIEGQNVVVVGASNIVGKPTALMLMARDATVSICHAKTRDLAQFTILADILVVAAGVPRLIVPQMVKQGAVVIDVGINRLPDGTIIGDVDFDGVARKASHITPVPGGVGPMTVTMLLSNTVDAAARFIV